MNKVIHKVDITEEIEGESLSMTIALATFELGDKFATARFELFTDAFRVKMHMVDSSAPPDERSADSEFAYTTLDNKGPEWIEEVKQRLREEGDELRLASVELGLEMMPTAAGSQEHVRKISEKLNANRPPMPGVNLADVLRQMQREGLAEEQS